MKNVSIWKDTVKSIDYKRLEKDITTDVLIIGGGMTGISTLYHLRESNLEVVLVEQNKIGMGVTGNSTGKLNFLQDSLYQKIMKNFDEEVAVKYLKSQLEAIGVAVDIVRKNDLNCDLVPVTSYVYTNQDDEIDSLKELQEFLEKNGITVVIGDNKLVQSKYMIGVENTYLFHPLKFVSLLAQKSYQNNIYENTSILKIEKDDDAYLCYTDSCKIRVKWVVVASHYPYFNLPFLFPIKGSLEKSYLCASKYKEKETSLISYKEPFVSIRTYQDYLIYLSNSHNISSKLDDGEHYKELKKKAGDLDIVPDYMWSNIDIMTNDGLPYIGEIGDGLLIGTGYNTWGMANGILAGKILTDKILGEHNPYFELFYPKRMNLSNIVGGVKDGYYSAASYVKGYFLRGKVDNVEYQERDGKKVAIYRDKKGEHIVYIKCPHMGCSLVFNEVEKTWDCPCHASRFDIDGHCISGPANRDISYTRKDN